MERDFPCGTYQAGKQDFRRDTGPESFPLERPQKSCVVYFSTGISDDSVNARPTPPPPPPLCCQTKTKVILANQRASKQSLNQSHREANP